MMRHNSYYGNRITFDDDSEMFVWRYSVIVDIDDMWDPIPAESVMLNEIKNWLIVNFGSSNFNRTWRGLMGMNKCEYLFTHEEDAVLFELSWG